MKLYSYELTDWQKFGENIFRCYNTEGNAAIIGLRKYTKSKNNILPYYKAEMNISYHIMIALRPMKIIFDQNIGRIFYSIEELEDAKQDIDNFIIRMNKLQALI